MKKKKKKEAKHSRKHITTNRKCGVFLGQTGPNGRTTDRNDRVRILKKKGGHTISKKIARIKGARNRPIGGETLDMTN